MRNRRSILILLLAIALLVLAHFAVRSYDDGRKTDRRQALVERNNDIAAVRIERRGNAALVLRRNEEEGWRIVEPFAGRADEQSVARLVDALSCTPVVDVVADGELVRLGRTRADFSLEEPLVKVVVDAGTVRETVSFGMPTPSGDGVYAAVDGVNAVYVVPSDILTSVDRPIEAFRRRIVFSVGPKSISSFAIRQGTGVNLSFTREDDGWRIDGERASKTCVEAFLSELLSVQAVGFFWPVGASNETERASASLLARFGLEPESAVAVTLKGVDGEDRQIMLGKSADTGLVYASVQNGGAVVSVKESLKTAALQKRDVFTDSRLFPVAEQSVGFFRIVDGDATCVLARSGEGTWRLESPVAAPADDAVVRRILARILALPATSVTPEARGFSVSMSADSPPVGIPKDLVLGGDRIDDLRSVEMLRIDPKVVKRLVRMPGEKKELSASVVRGEDGTWRVESAEGDAGKSAEGIAAVLETLNPLTAIRVERLKVSAAELDSYGLGRPFLTVAVDLDREDAVRRNVLVGAKTGSGRFATVGSSDAVFVISEETVRRLADEPIVK